MEYRIEDEKQMADVEHEARQRQQLEAKERVQREAAALMRKLTQDYDALNRLMEQNPEVTRQVTERATTDKEFHWKLRKGLELADAAPRCRWVKQDGTTCRSPQIKKHIYCFAHKQMMEARALALSLPAAEDANAIQISVMRIQKALIDDTISAKKAGLLLYSLQLAITNIGQTTFGKADERELATNLMDEEGALAEEFTAEDAERAKEQRSEKGLLRNNTNFTDRTDLPRSMRIGTEDPNGTNLRQNGMQWVD